MKGVCMVEKRMVLTESQEKTYETIRKFIEEKAISPTTREIAEMLDITAASVHEQLVRLEKKGLISKKPRIARSIRLTEESDEKIPSGTSRSSLVRVPVLGRIAAGNPVFAHEEYGEEIFIDESNIGKGRFFALEVQGDSMIEADINNGDLVVVKKQPVADKGEIIAALIDDEATVKRLEMLDDKIVLKPENRKYTPIDVTYRDDFRILGVVVSVISSSK